MIWAPARCWRARAPSASSAFADVSEQLKYGVKQIEALEADDYGRLPGTTFVRGMIRSYAKLVAWIRRRSCKALERRNIPAQVTVDLRTQRIPFLDGNKRATRLYLALSVVVLVAVAVVAYEWHFAEVAPAPVPVSVAPPAPRSAPEAAATAPVEPDTAAPDTVAPAAPAALTGPKPRAAASPVTAGGDSRCSRGDSRRIQLEFEQESWVEIKDRERQDPAVAAQSGRHAEGGRRRAAVLRCHRQRRQTCALTYNDAPVDLRPYFKVDVARLTLE